MREGSGQAITQKQNQTGPCWAERVGDDEVVVLQADSETELRHTHGRYFKDLADLSVLPAH